MIHLCYWVFQIAVQSVRLKNWMKFIEKASQPRVLKRNVDCQSTWEPLRVIIFLDWIIVNFALLIHFFLFKWRAYLILHSVILSRNRTADENLCRRNFVTSSSLKMSFLLFLAFILFSFRFFDNNQHRSCGTHCFCYFVGSLETKAITNIQKW